MKATERYGKDNKKEIAANDSEIENATKRLDDLAKARKRLDEITAARPELTEARDTRKAESATAREEARSREVKLAEITGALEYGTQAEAKKEAERLETEYSDWETTVEDLRAKLEKLKSDESALAERERMTRESLTDRTEAARSADNALCDALRENGFTSIADMNASLLEESEFDDIKKKTDDYAQDVAVHEKSVRRLSERLNGQKRADTAPLESAESALKETSDGLAERILNLKSRVERNGKCENSLSAAFEKFKRAEAEYANLASLSKAANGQTASESGKISFERYIQISYFQRVLSRANRRFLQMTDGQFELTRSETVRDMRSQTGLELDVINHFTGATRSVRTLSGGESFMASLSLALGFADTIRETAGGMTVDCLFVDEGFGSLDPASLDLVVRVLDRLSGGEKLIGIISHVAELRSRIDKKIIVTRDRSGSSIKMYA